MGDGHSSVKKRWLLWKSGNRKISADEVWCQGWSCSSMLLLKFSTDSQAAAHSMVTHETGVEGLVPVPTCHHSWGNFFYTSWLPGSQCRWGHWTFKRSAASFFESRSLNVTNRKAFSLSMLLDLSLNLDCQAIKLGPWETWTKGERGCRRPKRHVSDRAMNQPLHSWLLSRKQMPGREQSNLGNDIRKSDLVKACGQPEGRLNKNSKMQGKILWESQVTCRFYCPALLVPLKGQTF